MVLTAAERKELALHKARVELSHHLIKNSISLEETAWLVLDPVLKLTDGEMGFVSYLDAGTKENVGFIHVSENAHCFVGRRAIRFPMSEDGSYRALWGHALNTRQGFYTNDPAAHPAAKGVPVNHVPLRNFLTVPVTVGRNLLGQIAVANKPTAFDDEDLRIVGLFGELYGLALDRKFSEQALMDAERKAAERLERRFKAFMNATPDRLHIVSVDGVMLDSHFGRLPFIAKNPSEVVGKTLSEMFPDGDIAAQMLAKIREAIANDGRPVVWEYVIPQLPDHVFEGHIIKSGPDEAMVVVREVTTARKAQVELERKVRERTADLEASNATLQSFAWAASHDLREPLNKIQAYGQRFLKHHPDLDAKGQEDLGVMTSAADRLSRLVENLLQYAKAGGKDDDPLTDVDLNRIVAETLSDLDESIKGSGAVVTVGPLPTVRAHATKLRHVFQNLLSNAIKFRKPGRPPTISVTGRTVGNDAVVVVRDDGIGFDPANREKIFTLFNRLHNRFDYPGTGVGLALCRRLLAQYGGTVSADACPDEGAAFIVKIPTHREV